MAKKKRTKEDYPIVKYRVITGDGYFLFEGDEEKLKQKLKERSDWIETLTTYHKERLKAQYVVKVTEEYIDLNTLM